MSLSLVLTTLSKDIEIFKNEIIDSGLCICVLELPVTSCYIWENQKNEDKEKLLILKTLKKEELIKLIESIHPYEVPFISSVETSSINQAYLDYAQSLDRSL